MSSTYFRIADALLIASEKMQCSGPIVASATAIYVIPEEFRSAQEMGMAAAGGALGAALGRLGSSPSRALRKYTHALPASVAGDPGWPLRRDAKEAIVFTRNAVKRLRYPWWGGISFDVGGETIRISPSFLRRKQIIGSMREMGWKFD